MRIQVSLTDLSWIDYGDCKPSVESATANKVDYARARVFSRVRERGPRHLLDRW